MIEELEDVVLTVDLPEHHLKAGDIGTVVDMTPNGQQVTLEFFTLDGKTIAVVPVPISHVRKVSSGEIAHVRVLER